MKNKVKLLIIRNLSLRQIKFFKELFKTILITTIALCIMCLNSCPECEWWECIDYSQLAILALVLRLTFLKNK